MRGSIWVLSVGLGLLISTVAQATTYDEAVNGDLSDNYSTTSAGGQGGQGPKSPSVNGR